MTRRAVKRRPAIAGMVLAATLAVSATVTQGDSRLDEGTSLLEEGRFDEAVPLLEAALGAGPTEPDVLLVLIEGFDVVIEAQPGNARAHASQAVAYELAGNPLLAAQAAEQALRLDVSLAGAHYSLGLAWGRLGNTRAAMAEQDWLARNDPRLASQLTAELVLIDPLYQRIEQADPPGDDETERPLMGMVIDDMPEIIPVEVEPDDSISLLGVAAEGGVRYEEPSRTPVPDMTDDELSGDWILGDWGDEDLQLRFTRDGDGYLGTCMWHSGGSPPSDDAWFASSSYWGFYPFKMGDVAYRFGTPTKQRIDGTWWKLIYTGQAKVYELSQEFEWRDAQLVLDVYRKPEGIDFFFGGLERLD